MLPPDDGLCDSGASSDPEAFCRKYRPELLIYARTRTRDEEDANDAVSHVFEEILKKYASTGKICSPGVEPLAWSKKAITNYLIDRYRRRSAQKKIFGKLVSSAPDFTEEIHDNLVSQQAYDFINDLKPSEHQIAVLRYIEELSYAEIAQLVGRREVTVRTTVHRINKKMQKRLGATNELQKPVPRETI